MTREEFIDVLNHIGYDYEIVGDKIVINGEALDGELTLYLETIPENVVFNNPRDVSLRLLDSIPAGVEFNNGRDIFLDHVNSIDPSVRFNNGDSTWLSLLTNSWVNQWGGNIEGIDDNRLFNFMISKGMFI